MKQSDVYWVRFAGPAGRRPAVILTRSTAIGYLRSVTVAPVTTTIRGAPTEVLLAEADGMSERCVVTLDNIQTVLKSALDGQVASLGTDRMQAVRSAIEFALGFDTIDRR